MLEQFSREALIIGEKNVELLNNSKVAIFGIGGVGSFVVEGLARAGIGNFILIDNDVVDVTNINRQIIATTSTIGIPKVEIAKKRILDINPKANIRIYQEFFDKDSQDFFDNSVDYVIDCIDTISSKIEIVVRAKNMKIPVISSMGTGNKLNPTSFEIDDIYKTSVCPLAKIMRKELKKRKIDSLKVLYSKESPIISKNSYNDNNNNNIINVNNLEKDNNARERRVPGSISFVPSVAGLIIAGEVVKDIIDY